MAQQVDNKDLSGLKPGDRLSAYEAHLYLITGEEEIYSRYKSLKENVKRNIANGIREGIYRGNKHNRVSELKASKTTLFFYKEVLFKVRWDFAKEDFPELKETANTLINHLTEQFGNGSSENVGPFKMLVWEGNENYLKIFIEEESIQIELRIIKKEAEVNDLIK